MIYRRMRISVCVYVCVCECVYFVTELLLITMIDFLMDAVAENENIFAKHL